MSVLALRISLIAHCTSFLSSKPPFLAIAIFIDSFPKHEDIFRHFQRNVDDDDQFHRTPPQVEIVPRLLLLCLPHSNNSSFVGVNMKQIGDHRPDILEAILYKVTDLFEKGKLTYPSPSSFNSSHIPSPTFSHFQAPLCSMSTLGADSLKLKRTWKIAKPLVRSLSE